MKVELPNDFAPRDYQKKYMRYFDKGGKRAIWVVHRRGGKDLTSMHQTCKMMHKRKGGYWHVYPTAEQGRKAIWEGFTKDGKRILENVFPGFLEPRRAGSIVARTNESQMFIELKCGALWRLIGSDRVEVVGAGPVGVVFSEYAVAKPTGWNFIAPMLDENEGWASFITTPRGNNHAKKLFDSASKDPTWFSDLQTLYDTRAYDPEKTIADAQARGMPESLIRQEYLCDWTAALVGSVWGDVLEATEKCGGMAMFDHNSSGVFTSWDLGISDSTSIWFWQLKDGGIDFIDHYENHGQPLSHYFDKLEELSKTHGYQYNHHWLPHDARARTLQTGTSILEQCLGRWGAGKVAIGPSLSLMDGIQAGRWLLQQGVRFHPRCIAGVEALKQYHYDYNEDKMGPDGQMTFSNKPAHDWSSHTADAFRYTAVVVKVTELLTRKPEAKSEPTYGVPLDKSFNLDQLHDDRKKELRRRRW